MPILTYTLSNVERYTVAYVSYVIHCYDKIYKFTSSQKQKETDKLAE